jgi:hypothetical protein
LACERAGRDIGPAPLRYDHQRLGLAVEGMTPVPITEALI